MPAGSTGPAHRAAPPSRTAFDTHWFTTPACATMRRFGRSIDSMRFSRLVQIITGAATGSVPPESPVPAPRGTNAIFSSQSSRTTAATSAGVRGSTTSSGVRALERVAVAFVDTERVGVVDDAVVADQRADPRREAIGRHGAFSGARR